MTSKIALYTYGQFIKPSEHPDNDGFHERNDPMLNLVEKASGFIARSGYDGDPGPLSWGKQVYPRFNTNNDDGWAPSTLSLWHDLESIMAYTYFGGHGEAFSKGREWFQKPSPLQWPPFVTWWVASDHTPDWQEGADRLEYLFDHGPSAHAFNTKFPFDKSGQESSIDKGKLKAIRGAQIKPA